MGTGRLRDVWGERRLEGRGLRVGGRGGGAIRPTLGFAGAELADKDAILGGGAISPLVSEKDGTGSVRVVADALGVVCSSPSAASVVEGMCNTGGGGMAARSRSA